MFAVCCLTRTTKSSNPNCTIVQPELNRNKKNEVRTGTRRTVTHCRFDFFTIPWHHDTNVFFFSATLYRSPRGSEHMFSDAPLPWCWWFALNDDQLQLQCPNCTSGSKKERFKSSTCWGKNTNCIFCVCLKTHLIVSRLLKINQMYQVIWLTYSWIIPNFTIPNSIVNIGCHKDLSDDFWKTFHWLGNITLW